MNLWNYYNGDLKYPDITKHSRKKEIAKAKPKWAFKYVSKHGEDKELEPAIAKKAEYSYEYSKWILHGPFPLGEPAIAKDSYYSYLYAFDILEGPFKLGEPEIAKSETASKRYTHGVLKKDFYLDGKLICKYKG